MLEPYKLLKNWQLLFSVNFILCVCVCACVCAWECMCVHGVVCLCLLCCALCCVCACMHALECACMVLCVCVSVVSCCALCVYVCTCAWTHVYTFNDSAEKKEDSSKLNRQQIISYLQFQQFSVQTLSPWSSAPRQSSPPAPASLPLHKIKFNRNIRYQSTSAQCLGTPWRMLTSAQIITYSHIYKSASK